MLKYSTNDAEEVEKEFPGLEEDLWNMVHPDDEGPLLTNVNEGLTWGGGVEK